SYRSGMLKAAIYVRVSSESQTVENQLIDLRRLAEARGVEVVEVYQEKVSAVKKRPEYDRMMRDAHKGKFQALLVWAIDRLGRSMASTTEAISTLLGKNIRIISHQETWIETDGPMRPLLVAIMTWVGEQERARLIERTKAGVARARKAGIRLGRPSKRIDPNQ